MCKHVAKGNGLQNFFEFMIEHMPVAERNEFLIAISAMAVENRRQSAQY